MKKVLKHKKLIISIVALMIVLILAIIAFTKCGKKPEPVPRPTPTPTSTPVPTNTPTPTSTPTPTPTPTPVPKLLDVYGITIPDLGLDFEKIHTENSKDIYSWIYIPNTNVNYPVLMSDEETDTDFYLDHNMDGSKGFPGCIYVQKINSRDYTDHNTVLYGHNMADATMFGSLHYYENADFFADKNNRYLYMYTEDGHQYAYEIFAEYKFTNELILTCYDCDTDEGFGKYLDVVQTYNNQWTNFDDEIKVTSTDRILTLCTCCGDESRRYLVQARLINYDDLPGYEATVEETGADSENELTPTPEYTPYEPTGNE